MQHDALPLGTSFFWRAKLWHVAEKKTQHQKIHAVGDDGDDAILNIEEFRSLVSSGDIEIARKGNVGSMEPVPVDWKARETEKSRSERLKREAILGILKTQRAMRAPLIQTAKAIQLLCEERGWNIPCERTLRNWKAAARSHESMLSPRWSQCGNRRQGPDEPLMQAMREVTLATIAGSDRFTLAYVWSLILPLYEKKCAESGKPAKRHSIKKLLTFLRHFNWKKLTEAQLDGRTAAAITRKAVGSITAAAYWERVELDACLLEIQVCDSEGISIGRPVMYAAVDVCTGYPVAVYITMLHPSVVGFVECLRFMYLPKGKEFDKRYRIENRVEVYGKPYLLIVDNGSELIGRDATKVATAFHGDSARCRPYRPWEKPHIERFNGIVQNFVHTLPGSTVSTRYAAPRDPVAAEDKLMSLEKLRGQIYRFVYDKYAFQVNELRSLRAGKAAAPVDLWRLMQSSHISPMPISEREFDSTMYFEQDARRLRHDGIEFDGWTYHSPELARMHDEIGNREVKFMWSLMSAKIIRVLHPVTQKTVVAHAKQLTSDMDRVSASRFKLKIKEDGKILDKRSSKARLNELEEHKAYAAKTRTRGNQARLEEMAATAEERLRRTMPLMDGDTEAEVPTKTSWDFDGVAGKTKGAI